MDKKKIIITGIIVGAIIIVVIIALSLVRSQMGAGTSYNSIGDATYEKSAPIRSSSETMISAPAEDVSQGVDDESGVSSEKKIIKSGNMTLKVIDADDATFQITRIAKDNGGDIFSTSLYEGANNIKSGTVTVKVLVANFEKAFIEIKKVASLVVRESISGQDVTEQYTDLQSRLKNKQVEEQAFAAILQRSGQIDDVLKVTRELARVRGEIEVFQGRIKLLESQTDMSTITAQISEDAQITITDKWRPFQVAKDALNNLFKDIQKFVNFAIVLLIRVIPVIIVYLVFIWIIYLVGRKIYRKIKDKKNQGQQ